MEVGLEKLRRVMRCSVSWGGVCVVEVWFIWSGGDGSVVFDGDG